MRRALFAAMVVTVVLGTVGWAASARSAGAPRASWEYLVVYDPSQNPATDDQSRGMRYLNDLGAQGWELVGVSDEVTNSGNQSSTKLFFKRAR